MTDVRPLFGASDFVLPVGRIRPPSSAKGGVNRDRKGALMDGGFHDFWNCGRAYATR
jgi:hypothetical protein